jgi:hypothetical protein
LVFAVLKKLSRKPLLLNSCQKFNENASSQITKPTHQSVADRVKRELLAINARTETYTRLGIAALLFCSSAATSDASWSSLGRITTAFATGGASEVVRHAPPNPLPVNPKKAMDAVDNTIGKAEADTAKTFEKGVVDFGDTLAKAIDDTPKTIADVGIALYDFAGNQLHCQGRLFTDFEKRAFQGKWADAVAHLGIDRFRYDEINAAKAAQKSLILRTGGQILATVYGGPYGTAAYAAWYTYNVTKDPALSIKAGVIAGAASAATSAVPGTIGGQGTPKVVANAIINGSIAGVAAAASGGGKDDVLRAFAIAGTSVVIQSAYKDVTKSDIDPAPSKGEAYTKNTPLSYPDAGPNSPSDCAYFKNPDGSLFLDSDGNPHVDVRLLDPSRPMVGLAAGIGSHGMFYETNPVMRWISRWPVFNSMAVLHDVLCEQWNLTGFASKGTIPPTLVVTYYGTQAPTMELLLQDIQKKRDTPRPWPDAPRAQFYTGVKKTH